MMEKLGAPQTHLGLKAMIKVNKEQNQFVFLFGQIIFWGPSSFSNFLDHEK